ncbi:MAG: hypothetical protein ABSG46_20515 [Candidatus Binataceae bacterium]|jgi:hypothetical protein
MTMKDLTWEPEWLLKIERKFWFYVYWIRHPRDAYFLHKKWRDRPHIGDEVLVHGTEIKIVAMFGESQDDLIFTDDRHDSWMSCCSRVTPEDRA